MQRQVLAVVGLVVLVVTSGCVGVVLGNDVSFEAEPAVISDATASELGYELQRRNATTASRTVEVLGQQREISIRTWQTVYTRLTVPNVTGTEQAELANATVEQRREMANGSVGASVVLVVSTPDVRVLGQSLNPLARLSNRRLAESLGGGMVGGTSNLSVVERSAVTMLGSETNLTVFGSTVETQNGTTTESRLYVAKTPHESDVVVVIASHPRGLEGAPDRIETVVQNLEHPADVPASGQ